MSALRNLWRLLDRQERRNALLLQLLSFVCAGFTAVGITAIIPFFAILADANALRAQPILSRLSDVLGLGDPRTFAIAAGICFVATIWLANALNMLSMVMTARFAHRVGNRWHVTLFREYLRRGYGFHARYSGTDLSSRILYDVGRVASGVLHGALVLAANCITLALIIAVMTIVNPMVAFAGVACLTLCYGFIYLRVREQLRINGANESRYFEQRARLLTESFGAVKEITLSHRIEFFVGKFAEYCRTISEAIVGTLVTAQAPRYVLEGLLVAALVGVALAISGQPVAMGRWLGELTFFAMATYRLLPVMQQIFASVARMHSDGVALRSIEADLISARKHADAQLHSTRNPSRMELRRSLQLENISFRFSPGEQPVIRGISLEVLAGTIVGCVGPNGSGKTTLVDLIAGLLTPDDGAIIVDDKLIDHSNRASWQASIAYVPQQTYLLDRSFAENIALGETPDEIAQDRLRMAIHLAQLDSCVNAWPAGVGQMLGERGAILSGGQRQKVALARALYRNASLLILDEATNALDALTTRELEQVLLGLRGACTIVVVAHQVEALRSCDQIVELRDGAIVRSGTFEQLFGQRPLVGETEKSIDILRTARSRAH